MESTPRPGTRRRSLLKAVVVILVVTPGTAGFAAADYLLEKCLCWAAAVVPAIIFSVVAITKVFGDDGYDTGSDP